MKAKQIIENIKLQKVLLVIMLTTSVILALVANYYYSMSEQYQYLTEIMTSEKVEAQNKAAQLQIELDKPIPYLNIEKLNEMAKNCEFNIIDGFEEKREKAYPGIGCVGKITEIQTNGHLIAILYEMHYIDKNGKDLSNINGYRGGGFREGKIQPNGDVKFDNSLELPKSLAPRSRFNTNENNE